MTTLDENTKRGPRPTRMNLELRDGASNIVVNALRSSVEHPPSTSLRCSRRAVTSAPTDGHLNVTLESSLSTMPSARTLAGMPQAPRSHRGFDSLAKRSGRFVAVNGGMRLRNTDA